MTCRRLLAGLALALAGAAAAHASTPAPLDPIRFAFPGDVASAPGAVSAGLALADLYAGGDPFTNPAAAPGRGATLAPQLLHVNRGDLGAKNRHLEQTAAFADFASVSVSLPWRATVFTLYGWQPAVRQERDAFQVGDVHYVGPSAQIQTDASTRELRGGLAMSAGSSATRAGLALEWTHRDDRYQLRQDGGSPQDGTYELTLTGDAIGGAAGVRWAHAPDQRGGVVVGAAVHAVPALETSGQQVEDLLVGLTTANVSATRSATWDAGIGTRWTLSPETRLFVSAGARGAQRWDGFDLHLGTGTIWGAGLEYRDPETPWTYRFGGGAENQPGAPEPRSGRVGAGVSYTSGTMRWDLGITHRTMKRTGLPAESDDRLVGGASVAF